MGKLLDFCGGCISCCRVLYVDSADVATVAVEVSERNEGLQKFVPLPDYRDGKRMESAASFPGGER